MMRGFYLLAVQQRRRKMAAFAACLAAALSLVLAARTTAAPKAVAASVPEPEPYVASSEGGKLIVYQGGEVVMETGIDVRTLPAADRSRLEKGISVPDYETLAHLLEDYSS